MDTVLKFLELYILGNIRFVLNVFCNELYLQLFLPWLNISVVYVFLFKHLTQEF
jgi:hypothetical protein